MSFSQERIEVYLNALAARTPVPGGGSASALGGALGTALGSMAALYTAGHEKFRAVEPQARELDRKLAELRLEFMHLMQQDADAYGRYRAARELPRGTAAEKSDRAAALAAAREEATAVPERILALVLEGLKLLESLAAISNPHLASDVASGAYFLEAAGRGAAMQVLVNCARGSADTPAGRRRAGAEEKVIQASAQRERVDCTVRRVLATHAAPHSEPNA